MDDSSQELGHSDELERSGLSGVSAVHDGGRGGTCEERLDEETGAESAAGSGMSVDDEYG